MEPSRMIGLMDGLFPFGKKSKTQENRIDSTVLSGGAMAGSGGAVVPLSSPSMTGVTKYLSAMPVDSGVSKYLKKHDGAPATGVAKYMVKQAQISREAPSMTRVAKYLATVERSKPAASSVAKYMARQLITDRQKPSSSVDRYVMTIERTEKDAAQLSGVAKYEAEQAKKTRRAEAQKLIEKYRQEEAQMAMERAAASAQVEQAVKPHSEPEISAATGVGRYVERQDRIEGMRPPASGVAKYVARQIVLESRKPPLSGVQRYLSKHHVYKAKPVVTSVASYLDAQEQKAKERPAVSGVSKYIIKTSLLSPKIPEKSGVAKYLLKQSQAAPINAVDNPISENSFAVTGESGVSRYIKEVLSIDVADQFHTIVEKCLEGEFIPASETAEHAVEEIKDIEHPAKNASANKTKATGVSKYLDKEVAKDKKKKASKRTGVEKYLIDIESS